MHTRLHHPVKRRIWKMILLTRLLFVVVELLQSNFKMSYMLSYIFFFWRISIVFGNLIVWKIGMNVWDNSYNEIKLENIFVILIWHDANFLALSSQLQKLNQWISLFWRHVVVSNEVYFENSVGNLCSFIKGKTPRLTSFNALPNDEA